MDSLIFDVDGTLWDSTAEVAEAWQLTCRENGIPCKHITASRLKQEFGKLLPDIGKSLFPDLSAEQTMPLMEKCCILENEYLAVHSPDPYPGVREVFRTLSAKIPLFIVSNCQSGYIEVFLQDTGLGSYVTSHLCPGDTGKDKAANIRTIAETFHLKDPAYVGDTIGDYNAVRKAGLKFIYAEYGFGTVNSYDYIIHSPNELLNLRKR